MAALTKLGAFGASFSQLNSGRYDGKTIATSFQKAILIGQFDLWRESYAGAVVEVFMEGTTTHADLYTDLNLTAPAVNPQVLLTETLNGRTFGKFTQSIYTPDSYYLVINGIEATGPFYPGIRSLASEDATESWVVSSLGGIERTAGQRAGDTIHVLDFGNFLEIDGSTAENTTTLTAAIGVASSANGGDVVLPAGVFQISTIELPADVRLVGQGMDATTLYSLEGDKVVTVTGTNACLKDLTLDGLNLEPNSVGVYAVGQNFLTIDKVTVKRFDTGFKMVGGANHHYRDLYTLNCSTNVELRGDMDASSTNLGTAFQDLQWSGGSVAESTLYGMRLRFIDLSIERLTIRDVDFEDNVGTAALSIEGSEQLAFDHLVFGSGNILAHIVTSDTTLNPFQNATFTSCEFNGSQITLDGSCKDVIFDRPILDGKLVIDAVSPTHPIMFRDAREASTVTQVGATDKISRWTSRDYGVYRGQTTPTATSFTIFKRVLDPGEVVHMEVFATGVGENSPVFGSLKKIVGCYAPAATLPFDTQTVNFVTGTVVSGQKSGATARIQSQVDAGVTGSLSIINLQVGPTTGLSFLNNEIITDTGNGSGAVDGAVVYANSVVIPPLQLDHFALPAGATTWDVDVTTSGREVQVKVKGTTTATIDWNVMVRQNTVRSL